MMETIFIIALVVGFVGLAVIAGVRKKWGNVAWWVFMGVSFGVWEAVQKILIGSTISRVHATIGIESPILGWLNALFIVMLFGGLIYHLVWDFGLKWVLKRKKE